MSEPILRPDGFDAACVGIVGFPCSSQKRLAYDVDKMVAVLVDRDGMDHDEAAEYVEFNIVGACVGEGGPVFFVPREPELSVDEFVAQHEE